MADDVARMLSSVQFFVTPWTIVHQAPVSMGFSWQEYWSRLPFPLLGIFRTQGSNPRVSPMSAGGFFTTEPLGKPNQILWLPNLNSSMQHKSLQMDFISNECLSKYYSRSPTLKNGVSPENSTYSPEVTFNLPLWFYINWKFHLWNKLHQQFIKSLIQVKDRFNSSEEKPLNSSEP